VNARKSRGGARRLVDIVGRRRALALLTGGDRIGYLADDSAESSASATRKESANISNEESEVTRGERVRQMKGDSRLLDWGLADRVTTRGRDGFQEALDLLRPVLEAKSTAAIRAIKRAVAGAESSRGAPDGSCSTCDKSEERAAFATVWAGPENLKAVRAATAPLMKPNRDPFV